MADHPNQLIGTSGGISDTGVATLSVPYFARSVAECMRVARGRVMNGLPEVSRTWTQPEDKGGLYIVSVVYEGKESPTDEVLEVTYSLRGTWEEEPVEAHPQISRIVELYGGQFGEDGRVTFPPTLESTGADGGPLPGPGNERGQARRNPFYGVDKYKKLGLVWARNYSVATIPAGIVARVGTVIGSPPGSPPELPGRSWIVLPPQATQRGNVMEVAEEYQMLDEATPEELYTGVPGLGGGGLDTGTGIDPGGGLDTGGV